MQIFFVNKKGLKVKITQQNTQSREEFYWRDCLFRITAYSFEVCDSLLNVGPCSQIAMGEPAFLSDEFSGNAKADPDVELVSTSGTIQLPYDYNFDVGKLNFSRNKLLSAFEQLGVKFWLDLNFKLTGHGKNGALCILQQTIRPQVWSLNNLSTFA